MVKGLHHVAVPVRHLARSQAFYCGVLGLLPCPVKANWLGIGSDYCVHLMLSPGEAHPLDPAQHLTLEVEHLEELVGRLLGNGLRPYQLTVDQSKRHEISAGDDPLTFGIGTVFVEDPDGNTVEFIQQGRGILREVLGSAENPSSREPVPMQSSDDQPWNGQERAT